MWESPINMIYGEMQTQIENDVYKVVQNVGIDVDKEELLKALMYDRNQYDKGYKDGYNKAIDEFAEMVELEILTMLTSEQEYRIAKKSLDEIAEQMKGV